ncbi:LacI family DNA-binding transcriptional regulator [Ornithinimicrobium cavernae]|uniref:LacI family DNA-binding transcriptional regulator n=1 Tax=Ornithinimicrobium cavernae TaxID=2666047 RepID=UPI000D699137|nr:LacI family DNA-binding transcriptional regulator [Ornithinimicrobium cavernae]
MVTLRQVAAEAGVSLSTASRVLSGSDYPVALDLREKVEGVARRLDYVPNASAQALHVGSTRTIGLVLGSLSDPYFNAMAEGVEEAATLQGYPVTICATHRDPETELSYFRLLQAQRCRALIVAGSGLDVPAYAEGVRVRAAALRANGNRMVTIGRHPLGEADQILVDNVLVGRLVGEHLVRLGRRRVGALVGDRRVTSTTDRLAGLTSVVTAAGGEVLAVDVPAATRDGGAQALGVLLDQALSHTWGAGSGRSRCGLNAVFGTADQMAIGAMAALRVRGLSVPEDVSVVGCNDIAGAVDAHPALTTVHLPLREMGRAAVRLGLADASVEPRTVEMAVHLAVRESTSPFGEAD